MITAPSPLGTATVYEAYGRRGVIDIPLHQIVPKSRVAGPARTVLCGNGDNLMVHAAIAAAQAGDIIVITMPDPTPVGVVGDLLALQMKVRGVAGLLIDSGARDTEQIAEMGLPVWARFIRIRGATKTEVGKVDVPITVGGATINPGDLVIMDADGACVVPRGDADKALASAREREAKEVGLREKIERGELTYHLHGLQSVIDGAKH